jgi:FAD/FMN-containing dehydrogenase
VTYTGEVVVASREQHSDLLWASCGGGGGLGIVTLWTLKVRDMGADPVSRIEVRVRGSAHAVW